MINDVEKNLKRSVVTRQQCLAMMHRKNEVFVKPEVVAVRELVRKYKPSKEVIHFPPSKFRLGFTFGDAECVVSTSNKVIKCNKEVRVALGRAQKVLLGAPAHRLCQSFW